MMPPRIIGPEEAELLLADSTPGPWRADVDWAAVAAGPDAVVHGYFEAVCDSCGEPVSGDAHVVISAEDVALIAAAPDLAHTVATELRGWRNRAHRAETELAGEADRTRAAVHKALQDAADAADDPLTEFWLRARAGDREADL